MLILLSYILLLQRQTKRFALIASVLLNVRPTLSAVTFPCGIAQRVRVDVCWHFQLRAHFDLMCRCHLNERLGGKKAQIDTQCCCEALHMSRLNC